MKTIENQYVQLRVEEGNGWFSFVPAQANLPQVLNCGVRIRGHLDNGKPFVIIPQLRSDELDRTDADRDEITYSGQNEAYGIGWRLSFRLPVHQPFVFWQLAIKNQSSRAVSIDELTLLEPGRMNASNVLFKGQTRQRDLAFYSNGWQSWSSSGAYMADSRMRHSRLGILQEPMVLNPGTPKFHSAGRFSSDFFGVLGNRAERVGLLLGFLSQKQHFGSLTADLRGQPRVRLWANGDSTRLEAGASMSTDWVVFQSLSIDDPQPLGPYLEIVAQEHGLGQFPPAPAGWCSWYFYYEHISEEIIRANLRQIDAKKNQLPLNLVQIDDGFEAQVGDWLEFNPRFPNGAAPLAEEIANAGLTPGLWLAPFIVHPASRLAVDHPDWLLRQANGKLARPGFVWNSLGAALDLTVPAALEYACRVVDVAVHQWGFPYLKLDFLYAAALKGVYHDSTRTRAQVLRGGMEALRRTVGDETTLLGCGAPLGSVLGLVQSMRIGADVSRFWKPTYFGTSLPFRKEPHMPSARNSIQNILTRAPMHRRWWVNDPDCLLVGPDSTLTMDEVRALATVIGMTGGSVLLSDDMTKLPEERLELAAVLLPPMPQTARVLDWMDAETPRKLRLDLHGAAGEWYALAYFNWEDSAQAVQLDLADFRLPEGNYWVRSFWDNRVWRVKPSEQLFRGKLPAHAPLLLALRPCQVDQPQYLGSSLHISQGLELTGWSAGRGKVTCRLAPRRQANGAILDLYLPAQPQKVAFEGQILTWKLLPCGGIRFALDIFHDGMLAIDY